MGKSGAEPPPPAPTKYYKSLVLFFYRDSEKQRIETMDSVYKFSSTERIVLLEKELAVKLSELKTEVEDQGLFPGTGNQIFR